jgi:hypothetical protein
VSDSDDLVAAIEEEIAAPGKKIVMAYEQAPRKRILAVMLAEYRCAAAGCLLWFAWQSPQGIAYYIPGYKLSAGRASRETSPNARANNSIDGGRRWPSRGGYLEEFRGMIDTGGFMLQCDHVRVHERLRAIFANVESAEPGRPSRPRLSELKSACWCGSLQHTS